MIPTISALSAIASVLILLYLSYTDLKSFLVNVYWVLLLIVLNTIFLFVEFGMVFSVISGMFFLLALILMVLEHKGIMNSGWDLFGKIGITDTYIIFLIFVLLFGKGNFVAFVSGLVALLLSLFFVKKFVDIKNDKGRIRNMLSHMETVNNLAGIGFNKSTSRDSFYERVYRTQPIIAFFTRGEYEHPEHLINELVDSIHVSKPENPHIPLFPVIGFPIVILTIIYLFV